MILYTFDLFFRVASIRKHLIIHLNILFFFCIVIIILLSSLSFEFYFTLILQVPIKGKRLLKKHVFERTLAEEPSQNDVYDIQFSTEISSATATLRPPATTLDDVFISVKTTRSYHSNRLPIILKTWFQLAKKQVIEQRK